MKLIELASAVTSLFPFMILENLSSISSAFYHLHKNESMYKLVYISRHVDVLLLGYILKGYIDYIEIVFNLLSLVILYKTSIRDKHIIQMNIMISLIKSASNMRKLDYLVSLYFWIVAFTVDYDIIYGKYTDIIVNLLLCPPQYLIKKYIITV